MNFQQKLRKEMFEVLVTTLYFVLWFGVLMSLKTLYLSEYHIEVRGFSLALVGALVVAKVVLLMEHITLGQWIRSHAVALEILLRTILCTIGVALVLLLEKGFEARHEHGGFWNAVAWVFQHRDGRHVWADSIGVGAALFAYNILRAIRRHLGEGRLHRVFLSPPAAEPAAPSPSEPARTP